VQTCQHVAPYVQGLPKVMHQQEVLVHSHILMPMCAHTRPKHAHVLIRTCATSQPAVRQYRYTMQHIHTCTPDHPNTKE
jgi:hypothetical protein